MMKLFRNRRIKKFWQWLEPRIGSYERTEIDPTRIDSYQHQHTLELLRELSKIDKKLHIAYTVSDEKNPVWKLIISADGKRKKFALVQKIVAMAPQLQGWEIMAFRPRVPDSDLRVYLAPHTFMQVDKMYFDQEIRGKEIQINIYGEDLQRYTRSSVHEEGMRFLHYVVGEYNAVMKVHRFSFYGLNSIYSYSEVRPLTELHEMLAALPDKTR